MREIAIRELVPHNDSMPSLRTSCAANLLPESGSEGCTRVTSIAEAEAEGRRARGEHGNGRDKLAAGVSRQARRKKKSAGRMMN